MWQLERGGCRSGRSRRHSFAFVESSAAPTRARHNGWEPTLSRPPQHVVHCTKKAADLLTCPAIAAETQSMDAELTPLSFLRRSAEVYPDKTAIVYGDRRHTYREFAAEATGGRRTPLGGRRARRPRRLPAAQRPRDARRALRRAAGGRGARRDQHPAVHRGDPLHPRPLRVQAAGGRRGAYPMVAPVARRAEDREEIITVVDPGEPGRRHRLRRHLRRPARPRPRRRAARGTVGRRRTGADLDQLHVRDHGPAQGRDVHPPRRVPELPRRGRALRAQLRQRLPVDAADVPLQRLVHAVGRHGDRRHARLPARGARRRDLAADHASTASPTSTARRPSSPRS